VWTAPPGVRQLGPVRRPPGAPLLQPPLLRLSTLLPPMAPRQTPSPFAAPPCAAAASAHSSPAAQDVDKKRKGGPSGGGTRGAPPPPAGPQRVPGALNDLQLRRVDELADASRWVVEGKKKSMTRGGGWSLACRPGRGSNGDCRAGGPPKQAAAGRLQTNHPTTHPPSRLLVLQAR
jgi:hypothetical protein